MKGSWDLILDRLSLLVKDNPSNKDYKREREKVIWNWMVDRELYASEEQIDNILLTFGITPEYLIDVPSSVYFKNKTKDELHRFKDKGCVKE